MVNQKIDITRHVLDLEPDSDVSLEQALKDWYWNIRVNGGLRLTEKGYKKFTGLNIQSWSIDTQDSKGLRRMRMLLELDRKMHWPYYIDFKGNKIVMFSSKEAMLASLYGDIEQFLHNYNA